MGSHRLHVLKLGRALVDWVRMVAFLGLSRGGNARV